MTDQNESRFDLRRESWIPFRRRSGAVEYGPPSLITDSILTDPVVAIASFRPDFDGALAEFLIGILTLIVQPADEHEWRAMWDDKDAPSPAKLAAMLDELPAAFYLDGDGDRFLQDKTVADFADEDVRPIQNLLIEMAGANNHPIDTHPFVKPLRIQTLSRSAAAMALLTLQSYSPSGGRGHRTSLRGGGPLTTLIEPRIQSDQHEVAYDRPLWQMLWANVETREQWERRLTPRGTDVFPWMQPTRESLGRPALVTTPDDAHPLQCYFGMPRRVRLEFGEPGVCDLTHVRDEHPVVGIRTRPYGVSYDGWQHPLSPHYRKNASNPFLPVHGQPGGIGWKDWIGLTVSTPDENRIPAQTIAHFGRSRARQVKARHFGIHAFGYDVDNMKARDWTDARLPGFAIADEESLVAIRAFASQLVEGTGIAAFALQSAVDRASYERPEDVPGDRTIVRARLWDAMQSLFYESIESVADDVLNPELGQQLRTQFCVQIEREAQRLFDAAVGTGSYQEAPRRVVAAKYGLMSALRGYSSLGVKLFKQLGLPPREKRKAVAEASS